LPRGSTSHIQESRLVGTLDIQTSYNPVALDFSPGRDKRIKNLLGLQSNIFRKLIDCNYLTASTTETASIVRITGITV
jgi:hypothetical protein